MKRFDNQNQKVLGVTDQGSLSGFSRDTSSGAFVIRKTPSRSTDLNKRLSLVEDKLNLLIERFDKHLEGLENEQ